jgi:hypothetical protein
MNNPRKTQSGESKLVNSGNQKCIPTGAADDPHANERKSPCLEHPDYIIPTPCPVLVRRRRLARKTYHSVSALPVECKECELRSKYLDSL